MFRVLYFQKFLEVCISTNVSYPVMFHTLRKFWKMFHTLDTSTPGRVCRLKNEQQLNMLPGIHFLDHSKIIIADFSWLITDWTFRIWEISACETFFIEISMKFSSAEVFYKSFYMWRCGSSWKNHLEFNMKIA